MVEYKQTIDEITHHLEYLINKDKGDELLYEWLFEFLINGISDPLSSISPLETRNQYVVDIFNKSKNPKLKKKICVAIRDIYKNYLAKGYNGYTLKELLELIGRLNITDLFLNLWGKAWKGNFKNVIVEPHKKAFDLHTYLLKSIFSLDVTEKSYIDKKLELIKRDIHEPMYMLECFEEFYISKDYINEAIKYMPLLLSRINNNDNTRDYLGAIREFFRIMSIDNLCQYIPQMIKDYDIIYFDKLAYILALEKINLQSKDNSLSKYISDFEPVFIPSKPIELSANCRLIFVLIDNKIIQSLKEKFDTFLSRLRINNMLIIMGEPKDNIIKSIDCPYEHIPKAA